MKVRINLDSSILLLCSFLSISGIFIFFVEYLGLSESIPWTLTLVACAAVVILWGISLRFPILQVLSLIGMVALASHICFFRQASLGLLFDAFRNFNTESFYHLGISFMLEFLFFLLLVSSYITVSSACVLQSGLGICLPQIVILLFSKICSENDFRFLLEFPYFLALLSSFVGCALLYSMTARKKLCKKCSTPLRNSRGYWQTLLLLFVVLFLSFALLPICTDSLSGNSFQTPEVINATNFVAGRLKLPIIDPSSLDSFNLSNYGLYPLKVRLGGNPRQNDSVIMSVDSEHNVLLRAATYDQYLGQYWNSHNSYSIGLFSPDSFLSDSDDVFDSYRPNPSEIPSNLYDAVFDKEEIEITYLYDIGNVVFSPGHLLEISGIGDVNACDSGTLNAANHFSSGDTYTLVFEQFRTYSDTFTEDALALEAYILSHPSVQDSEKKMDEINEKYLDADVPDSVTEYAKSLTTEDSTPLEKVFAIQTELATTYTYSLTVSNPASNADFVSNFIETKEGYCTYFASAMTILSRINGIPARYVEGFSYSASDGNDLVLGTDAHAWCEVYIDGIGWIPIDATASALSDEISQTENQQDETDPTPAPTLTPTTMPTQITEAAASVTPQTALSPTPIPSISSTEIPSSSASGYHAEDTDNNLPSFFFVGLLLVLIFLLPCLLVIYKKNCLSLSSARHYIDKSKYDEALIATLQNVLQNLTLLKIRLDKTDTLDDLSSRLLQDRRRTYRRADHVTDLDIRLLVNLYEKAAYAKHDLSQKEIEEAYVQAVHIAGEVEAVYKTHIHYLFSLLCHSLDKTVRFP